MKLDLYQVDAFTDQLFRGNPACVVPLQEWLPDEILLKITQENAVAETAFFINRGDHYHLRWFTPEIEMDLCGHATLASAHVIKNYLDFKGDTITFETRSGQLKVSINQNQYTLDFPSRKPLPSQLPAIIKDAISIQPIEVLKSRDYVLMYDNEMDVRNIQINRLVFDQISLSPGGVIVTAKGDHHDFVSRFFTSQSSILEDPVTGSSHCSLIPFWSERLNKKEMVAMQVSQRSGELFCVDKGDRVWIGGQAKTYSIGHFWTE
ncbi:MAG: PhzF family phenazine biosynthesis protein [Saprospiraceae bacterium]